MVTVSVPSTRLEEQEVQSGTSELETEAAMPPVKHLQITTLYEAEMTPPATPNGSREELEQHVDPVQPIFHSFLRAFYPFNPATTISDATVTLPLTEGDVVLVHSIHTNGWADGTLLSTGARGWLPTNYCESYEPELMRNLLQALLNFWDLLRCGVATSSEIFGNQEFMRGIIAGVRCLLERSKCLTRESSRIQSNESLRRTRKSLLSDLSSLVKTAKFLQELVAGTVCPGDEDVNNALDEMVLKAFRIVTRGVRFHDVLEDELRLHAAATLVMPTLIEESSVPPTPPADVQTFDHVASSKDASSRRNSRRISGSSAAAVAHAAAEQTKRLSQSKRSSKVISGSIISPAPRPSSVQIPKQSVSHRVSTACPLVAIQGGSLVSERLGSSHDLLLSFLGSFIGRLHIQAQSSEGLLSTTRQSISAGRALLTIVEMVCVRDNQSEEALQVARNTMYRYINQLAIVARECIRTSGIEDDEVMMPQDHDRLKDAATDCVVAAGECVAKTKFVLERIGDFEVMDQSQGLGIDVSAFNTSSVQEAAADPAQETPPEPTTQPPPPPMTTNVVDEKPLPTLPTTPQETSEVTVCDITVVRTPTRSSTISLLPPLPSLASPITFQEEFGLHDNASSSESESQTSSRTDSFAVSTTESAYMTSMRGSETSMLSQTSTRATTPDLSPYTPSRQCSLSNLSLTGSQTTVADEIDETESKMMEKTFAHELIYNKEGQVTGGTLPALIERLTTHDSTPDATFVSTFYLTFRLFATPCELASALVDRFDHVAESTITAAPVRLRVYNVFKGWLESHWRNLSDEAALPTIRAFAEGRLRIALPAASTRLLDLAQKVSSSIRPLVPRLVSSMGKTTTSTAPYVAPDTPLPTPILTKNQIAALRNWKIGGSSPSILEFDPLELARQFTIKEMNIFCAIMPEELLASEWMKKSGSNAVNVRAMSTVSTDLSNLVADTILQYDDAKKRAMVVKHWIKIANRCLELNNYDSLMAIICSLNSSTIIRLKKTWDIVSQKRKDMLNALQQIIEPTKNHLVLRQKLHETVPPCLPFVGTYLTDLTFVDMGNPAMKQLPAIGEEGGQSVINFDKHTRTAKVIGELQRFQIPYRLTEVPELQEWIQAQIVRVRCSNDLNNVQQFYRKSLLLEPRTSSTKSSPVEAQGSFSSQTSHKERFDLFGWTHYKDRSVATTPAVLS